MILRRVIEHFRKQEWTAIALDFVIVVLGVFVGLQVNNWNGDRADHRAEREIIDAISDDIRRDREELIVGRESALKCIQAANAALVAAGEPPTVVVRMPLSNIGQLDYAALDVSRSDARPTDPDTSAWTAITARYFPTSSSVAFDSLVSTGRLGIIKNVVLVRQLQLYRQHWLSLENAQISTYREFRNRSVYVAQESGLSPFTNIDAVALGELIRERPELRAALRSHLEYAIIHLSQMAAMDVEAEATLDLIEAERSP